MCCHIIRSITPYISAEDDLDDSLEDVPIVGEFDIELDENLAVNVDNPLNLSSEVDMDDLGLSGTILQESDVELDDMLQQLVNIPHTNCNLVFCSTHGPELLSNTAR